MKSVYKMAKNYYPHKWNKAMIDNLLALNKLTYEEYNDIINNE